MMTLAEAIVFCKENGYDTIVQCETCGKRQYLNFANGLKNGWSTCCGKTMPLVYYPTNIEGIVGKEIKSQVKMIKAFFEMR